MCRTLFSNQIAYDILYRQLQGGKDEITEDEIPREISYFESWVFNKYKYPVILESNNRAILDAFQRSTAYFNIVRPGVYTLRDKYREQESFDKMNSCIDSDLLEIIKEYISATREERQALSMGC